MGGHHLIWIIELKLIYSEKAAKIWKKILVFFMTLKFIYFEKATTFCEISTEDLSYAVPVKITVEISQNFVAFSEYMNFT